MNEIFLDASFTIALSSPKDRYHQKALSVSQELEEKKVRLVTTHAVIFEIGNALSKLRYRKAAMDLINSLEQDEEVEILPVSVSLYQKGLELYQNRMDKEWGLTDCISFVVMKERNITQALTTDIHFQQNGFDILLNDK